MKLRQIAGVVLILICLAVGPRAVFAQASEEFRNLARALGDAVLRADDPDTLELAARIRALGQPVGAEINFAEAQALMRMHRNDPARDAIKRYIANGGKLQSRANAILSELDRREKAMNTSWRRKVDRVDTPLFYPDGSHVSVQRTGDDLAGANTVISFYDAKGDEHWRTVYGGTVYNYANDYIDAGNGRLVIGGSIENGGWRNQFAINRALAFGLDTLGRVTWQFNPQNQAPPGENVYSGWVRFLAPDRAGGFVMVYRGGHARFFVERYDAEDVKKWRYFYAPPAKHSDPEITGLASDAAGNIYVLYKREGRQPERIVVIDQDGRQRRELIGSPITKDFYNRDLGQLTEDNLYRDILSMEVSADGKVAYFLTQRNLPNSQKMVHEAYAISLSTGRQLWLRQIGELARFNNGNYATASMAVAGDGIVIAGVDPASAGPEKTLFIRKYLGETGTLVWERTETRSDKAYSVRRVQVFPSGITLVVGLFDAREFIHLAATEFEGVDDPFADLPAVAFLPYSGNSDARAEILYDRATANLGNAEKALAACRDSKVSENVVGRIRDVRVDWGFVIVDLTAARGLKPDMFVRLADGALIALKPGKEASANAVSATPVGAPIQKLSAGMDVVASGDIPDTLCPSELAALQTARAEWASTPRPATR